MNLLYSLSIPVIFLFPTGRWPPPDSCPTPLPGVNQIMAHFIPFQIKPPICLCWPSTTSGYRLKLHSTWCIKSLAKMITRWPKKQAANRWLKLDFHCWWWCALFWPGTPLPLRLNHSWGAQWNQSTTRSQSTLVHQCVVFATADYPSKFHCQLINKNLTAFNCQTWFFANSKSLYEGTAGALYIVPYVWNLKKGLKK